MKVPKAKFLFPLMILFAVTTGTNKAWAQGSLLADDPILKGSPPYEETVRRFLAQEQPKIIGGKIATTGAYPWQVSLGVSWITDPFRSHFCGGSVLSERWIVTAAHCAINMTPAKLSITAGTNKLVAGATRRNVKRIIVHRGYSASTHDNDIALLELADPLPTGVLIRPIPMLSETSESGLLVEDAPMVVTGWGATQEGGSVVLDLRYIDPLPFVRTATCNDVAAYNGEITENMICAGRRAGGVDSCQGDSGGPLSIETNSSPKLAGIVSWGEGCGRAEKVGVYTRVTRYVNWVNACMTNPNTCNN